MHKHIQTKVSEKEFKDIKKAVLDAGVTLEVFVKDAIQSKTQEVQKEKELEVKETNKNE